MDPKKMETWLGGEGGGASTAPPSKGAKPEKVKEAEEPEAEAEAEGSLEEEFPKLFPLLEENGEVIEDALADLDGESLADPDMDYAEDEAALEAFTAALDSLPDDVREAMGEELKQIDHEKALEIAHALEAGEHITDADKFAGFLFHGAAVLAAGATEDEEEEEVVEEEEPTEEVEPVESIEG